MHYTVVTGAGGFIGSCLLTALISEEGGHFIGVDDFEVIEKSMNHASHPLEMRIHRDVFPEWLERNGRMVKRVVHLGARTDTALQDKMTFHRLNLAYSQRIWALCIRWQIPLIYASSASVYGDGSAGFSEQTEMELFTPLNPYAASKWEFDRWVLEQHAAPPFWAGFRFFNVYGPNEYHKGRMASVVFHAFHQIREQGKLRLFRSHREAFADGMQARDFIYVMDVVHVLREAINGNLPNGIYNLGTGQGATFLNLAYAVFQTMGKKVDIEFIDIPEDIRASYQYYTCAEMLRLRAAGYQKPFMNIDEGVADYVGRFLMPNRHFLP